MAKLVHAEFFLLVLGSLQYEYLPSVVGVIMGFTEYAKGVSAEDIRLFLTLWPQLQSSGDEIYWLLSDNKALLFGEGTIPFKWCHLYELPTKQHFLLVITGLLENEQLAEKLKEAVNSRSQIGAIPGFLQYFDSWVESENLTKKQAEELVPMLAPMLVFALSVLNSLRCLLYHGCYLNELILRAPSSDKALFDAVRIDRTVIGCKPIIERISKAALLQEVKFFARLKAAMNGKVGKNEQANFQKMRLVFEILHEAGASRLSDAQLQELFVEELKLYTGNSSGGGSTKALRKFADTYMRQNATT